MEIHDYTTSGGKDLIIEYIENLPIAAQVEIYSVRELIQNKGIEAFTDYLVTRPLYKKLWEIKVSQERIMYVIRDKNAVYFLHICKKAERKNKNWKRLSNEQSLCSCYRRTVLWAKLRLT